MSTHAIFGLFMLVSCGPAQPADDAAHIVVPPQPPPVVTAPPTPAPIASVTYAAQPPVPFTCDGGQRFDTSDRDYCAYAAPETWDDAERRCTKTGGHLLSLETRKQSELAQTVLASPVRVRAAWIGLESPAKVRTGWKWITGEPVTDPSWNGGEPNNWDGNEACAEWLVASGRWNDTRCNLRQPYLCESVGKTTFTCTGHPVTGADKTYCFIGREASQPEAKTACTKMGGRLATPKTSVEKDTLVKGLAQKFDATRMWIGLREPTRYGGWFWRTNAPVSFTAWEPGEPNHFGDEQCAELFLDRWTWNDLDCAQKLPSVCEGAPKAP